MMLYTNSIVELYTLAGIQSNSRENHLTLILPALISTGRTTSHDTTHATHLDPSVI